MSLYLFILHLLSLFFFPLERRKEKERRKAKARKERRKRGVRQAREKIEGMDEGVESERRKGREREPGEGGAKEEVKREGKRTAAPSRRLNEGRDQLTSCDKWMPITSSAKRGAREGGSQAGFPTGQQLRLTSLELATPHRLVFSQARCPSG